MNRCCGSVVLLAEQERERLQARLVERLDATWVQVCAEALAM